MKKAEEYLKEALTNTHWNYLEHVMNSGRCYPDLIKTIKTAQIDAIDESVKRCANIARSSIEDVPGGLQRSSVNKSAILRVAEQLKKELE